MTSPFTESTVEEAALEVFESLGYAVIHGPEIAPGELLAERDAYGDVVLAGRLNEALARINPKVPADAIEEAVPAALLPNSISGQVSVRTKTSGESSYAVTS